MATTSSDHSVQNRRQGQDIFVVLPVLHHSVLTSSWNNPANPENSPVSAKPLWRRNFSNYFFFLRVLVEWKSCFQGILDFCIGGIELSSFLSAESFTSALGFLSTAKNEWSVPSASWIFVAKKPVGPSRWHTTSRPFKKSATDIQTTLIQLYSITRQASVILRQGFHPANISSAKIL
jgi:hypothetical protein